MLYFSHTALRWWKADVIPGYQAHEGPIIWRHCEKYKGEPLK
jgi:hypothetical protein